LGYEFHRQVNHTARSPRLAQLLSSVANSLSLRFYASVVHEASSSVTEHGAIVRAFEAGDVEKARTVMNDHVIQGADSLIKQLEMHHVWDYAEE
jgi:DNA-binding GntR family transcriptional regulator